MSDDYYATAKYTYKISTVVDETSPSIYDVPNTPIRFLLL